MKSACARSAWKRGSLHAERGFGRSRASCLRGISTSMCGRVRGSGFGVRGSAALGVLPSRHWHIPVRPPLSAPAFAALAHPCAAGFEVRQGDPFLDPRSTIHDPRSTIDPFALATAPPCSLPLFPPVACGPPATYWFLGACFQSSCSRFICPALRGWRRALITLISLRPMGGAWGA